MSSKDITAVRAAILVGICLLPGTLRAHRHHAGATFSYMPLDNLMFSGDLAGSQIQEGQEHGSYMDLGARVRGQYLLGQKLGFDTDSLNLQPHYFDGVDPKVADRGGGEAGFAWNLHRQWTLEGGMGEVRNNLVGQLDHTTGRFGGCWIRTAPSVWLTAMPKSIGPSPSSTIGGSRSRAVRCVGTRRSSGD